MEDKTEYTLEKQTIRLENGLTVGEFIELLQGIEDKDKRVMVPDWQNYGSDEVSTLIEYVNMVVID